MASQSPVKIKEEYDENSFNNVESKPSTARDLSSELDDDFPISEPSEIKQQSSLSVNLQRHFIASPKDSKHLVEIKRDHNVHLPLLLRKNWRKKPNPTTTTTSAKKVSSKMSGRNAVHCSSTVSGGPPPKIRRNA
uniref:Uncharacterized protein n=1 Tax=Panagrolaimus superbus TaxID=310955 RepID=A0A914YSF3_9BILA